MTPWIYALSLLALGLILILLDIFITPGVDILGILGVLTVGAGIALAYVELGLWPALVIGGIGLTGTVLLIWRLFHSRSWHRLVLQSDISRTQGCESVGPGLEVLLGQRGEASTVLRPSGRATFGERVVDVVSEGAFVDRGEPVEVLRVVGNKVTVHRAPEEAAG